MSVEEDAKVSFVEKALNRLKRQQEIKGQQEKVVPLGEVRNEPVEAKAVGREPVRLNTADEPAAESAAETAISANSNSPLVAVDRQRLRDEGFLAPERYRRQLADEYRVIKRPLIANAFGIGVTEVDNGNLMLVTSAIPGEGKTHTCINLALSMAAERDRTVLLIDGDVAKPHISRLFGVADRPGLLDALGDNRISLDKLLVRTDIPGLTLLPAGRWTEYTTELLASGRMRELTQELAGRYSDRIILFDSPPLLATTEAQAIAATVGQIVLVIAENMTPRDQVRAALNLLDRQKPINAILNKSRLPIIGGYYYGGYGYGHYGDGRQTGKDDS